MYTIAEEDSFLPALLTNNPTKQLAQIRGYREQQKLRQIYLARDMEEIRMAYALRICQERERVRKSLWELDNRKRRLMLQMTNNKNPYLSSSSKSKGRSKHRGERERYRERSNDERKDKGKPDKQIKAMLTPVSRLPTAAEPDSRMGTAVSTRQETARQNRKQKWKEKQAKPEIPRYLLC